MEGFVNSEVVVEKQLVVLLYVVVRLVFIEMVGAVVVGVHIQIGRAHV